MSDNPTREEILASIVAKSDQVNAEDLLAGPQTYTITKVTRGSSQQPINIHLEGTEKQFRPCKTCRRILISVFGDDPKNYIGQKVTLFCDPSVVYAGIKVGGVRISRLSGLTEPLELMLTKTRGKKEAITINPIAEELTPEDRDYIEEVTGEIAAAETPETLKAIKFIIEKKSQAVRDALRSTYLARQKELKQ